MCVPVQNKDLKSRVSHLEGVRGASQQDSVVSRLTIRIQDLEDRLQGEKRWAHTHTRAHTHRHTHTGTHTHGHAHTRVGAHKRTHTRTHAGGRARTHTHTHTYIHTYINTLWDMLDIIQLLTCVCVRVCPLRDNSTLQQTNRKLERKMREMKMQVDEENVSLQNQRDQVRVHELCESRPVTARPGGCRAFTLRVFC